MKTTYELVFKNEITDNESVSSKVKGETPSLKDGGAPSPNVANDANKIKGITNIAKGFTVLQQGYGLYKSAENLYLRENMTNSVISGNMISARNLAARTDKRNQRISAASSIISSTLTGAVAGPWGAVAGFTLSTGTMIFNEVVNYRNEIRLFDHNIKSQNIISIHDSRRLVDYTGRMR